MRSRKLLALLFCLITFPAIAGYMTLLGAGVGNIAPTVSWVAGTDAFPSTLSFSRTSNATMFDSTGYLTYAPNNLALNTAALGTQSVTVQVGTNYLISFASGGGSIALSGAGAGTVTSASPVKITASTTTLTLTVTGTVTNAVVAAVTYETTPRTADQVITTASAYYGPRIDYDPNTLAVKGLLIEEARTNVALNSNNFGAGTWTPSGVTVTPNAATGPDGTTSASTLAFTTAGFLYAANYAVANGTYTITVSVWLNGTAGSKIALRAVDAAAGTGGGSSVLTMTGQLTRFTFTQTVVVTGGSGITVGFENRVGVVPALPNLAVSVSAYGFQIEVGSQATSYIATAAAAVSRAADSILFKATPLAAMQGSAASLITEVSIPGSAGQIISFPSSQTPLYASNTITVGSYDGATVITAALGSPYWAGPMRVGSSWSAAGRSIVANGGTVVTGTNAFASPASAYLGSVGGSSAFINGWIKSFAIYNQRLPDATLQAKSVVGASYAANDNGLRFANNDNLPIHWRVAL